jgi:hypothetical protein
VEAARIVAVSVFAAILYGVVHDQITVRVCLEYFTIGHPPVFPTQDPTLLALGWGVIATWWVGLPLGILLAVVSRQGSQIKLVVSQLIRPLFVLLACMGIAAMIAGTLGAYFARNGGASVNEFILIPEQARVGFIAALWSHTASYASGIIGGLALVVWAARQRRMVV